MRLSGDPMWMRIIFAAALYLPVLSANAQQFTVTRELHHLIEKKDGFENARCFILDHKGFFWIGTADGIIRYNGNEVDRLEDLLNHESRPLRDITALHLDNTGNIWIGAMGKVDRLSVSSMTLDEVHMVSGDSMISRLPEINDIHVVENDRLLISTFRGLYILTRGSDKDSTWNVSHFSELKPTTSEFGLIDSLQQSSLLISSLIIKDSLRHSVGFSVKDTSELLIVSTSPKMFSGIDENNDMAWIENQSGEKIWSKYDQFYFLALHPTIVSLPPGKYTLYGRQKLYNYFRDISPEYKVSVYHVSQESARLFRRMTRDWLNRRSIVEDNTGEISADEQGTIWITGGGGLTSLKFVNNKPAFKVYTPHEGKEYGQHGIHTFSIRRSRSNGFWLLGRGYSRVAQLRQRRDVFSRNHIMFYEAAHEKFLRLSFEGADLISDIAEDVDSTLWVLYWNGTLDRVRLDKRVGGVPQLADHIDLRLFGRARKVYIDRLRNLWVLTEKQGLIKITISKNQLSSWSWPHDKVWFGKSKNTFDEFLLFTGEGGVFKSRIREELLHARIVGKLEQPVIDFVSFSDSTAIAVTRDGKIDFLNKHFQSEGSIRIDSMYFNPRSPIASIRLVRVSDDTVYLCTSQGLFSINVAEKKISTTLLDLQPQSPRMISDVLSFRGKHLAVVNIQSYQGHNSFIVPIQASERKKGLINRGHANLPIEINTVVKWSDRILVGSEVGIHEYDVEMDTFLLLTPSGYPPVYNMVADDRGYIWTIGRDGVTCFDHESGSFHTVVAKLPLPAKKFNELSPPFWQNDKEHISFVVDNRLYNLLIDTAHVQKNKPLIHFDNIGMHISPGENLKVNPIHNTVVLSPGQKTFTVDFAATDLEFPERAYFSYRLIGYHEDWINTTHSEIQFINVPHGDYTLDLRVVDGLRKSSKSMSIRLEPLWWQTNVARICFGAVLLLVSWGSWRAIMQREHLKSNLKLEQVEREKKDLQLEKAQEIEKAKNTFFTNISHEFRTPLTLIKGPAQNLLAEFSSRPSAKKQLQLIQHNADVLLKLINQLLDLAKLESGTVGVNAVKVDLNAFLNMLIDSFSSHAKEKGIDLIDDLPEIRYHVSLDKDKVETIITNLLGNAVKFTSSNGRVHLNAKIELADSPGVGQLIVTVSDTGIGIPAGEQANIFERFYQVHAGGAHNVLGSGIGLSLVKELTELLGGTLTVRSEPGKGSEFGVTLPVEIISATKEDESVASREVLDVVGADEIREDSGKTKLMVVEDNTELRSFIISSFNDDYSFCEAGDGKEAIEIAFQEIPELIISDVMMPEMDGIAMTAKLKKDIRTSHIPIILLTAKATDEAKISGLNMGADDYLVKPFNNDELILKVRNMIASRNRVREKVRIEFMREGPAINALSADEKLLQKVKEVILSRLSDEQLSVDSLASEIGLSRAHFYRKITALTGLPVNELIQNFRLERGAQLLTQQWGPVSQVAFEVGFSNPSYFSKRFKEKFGVSPSEYPPKEKTANPRRR